MSGSGTITGTPNAAGTYSATITASNHAISVQEMGAGAGENVNISSSTLGSNLCVDASLLNLQVNGASAAGFCIDPWHWSIEGSALAYNWEILANGPKTPAGMGATVALQIEQLWNQYYTPSISNTNAAGLQIAIWDLVSASVSAATGGAYWFTLNSGNDYGASSMVSWVNSNPERPGGQPGRGDRQRPGLCDQRGEPSLQLDRERHADASLHGLCPARPGWRELFHPGQPAVHVHDQRHRQPDELRRDQPSARPFDQQFDRRDFRHPHHDRAPTRSRCRPRIRAPRAPPPLP